MTEPQGTSSSWLLDLTAFLRSVFLSFTNLPLKLAQMTCMSACQHLARSMMSMLMNESVKAISIGVLQQIDLDLCQCEQFAASEPIQGLEVCTNSGSSIVLNLCKQSYKVNINSLQECNEICLNLNYTFRKEFY